MKRLKHFLKGLGEAAIGAFGGADVVKAEVMAATQRAAAEAAHKEQLAAAIQAKHEADRAALTAAARAGHENLFGKTRGRFDEAAARAADRTLVEAAIAAILPMPAEEFARFVRLFNEIYDGPWRTERWSISRREM